MDDDDLESSFGQLDLGERLKLSAWGLPPSVVKAYRDRGIDEMFAWQAECMALPGVWTQTSDLVLSAPTSGGKSLVAELLAAKTVIRRGKKVVIVLPFKALVAEKTNYLKAVFARTGVKVVSFTGNSSACPFSMVDVAICVTEKANSLINRLVSEGSISSLGLLVADELHTLADRSRGYILEMLLSKIKFLKQFKGAEVQVIGMSATLGNLVELAEWLGAQKYETDFRPVSLEQRILVGESVFSHNFEKIEDYKPLINVKDDCENVVDLTVRKVLDGMSVLIFCMTKAHCENLAVKIAKESIRVGRGLCGKELATGIQQQITEAAALEMRTLIDACSPSKELRSCVCFGVAFHHAGLADDERAVVEEGFRSGRLRILVATSTLCSGVNLPASVVIVRMGNRLDRQMYLQMVGRAGRTGVVKSGESFLAVPNSMTALAKKLVSEEVSRVEPSLGGNLMRALLEAISTGMASSKQELLSFLGSTLYGQGKNEVLQSDLEEILEDLCQSSYVRQKEEASEPTRLGTACVAAGARPEDAKMLYEELKKAQKSFALDTELHLCYLTTPLYSGDWGSFDWLHWMKVFNSLPPEYKRVAELIGVRENFIGMMMAKSSSFINQESLATMERHQRFFKALAMMDLIQEKPLSEVSAKFDTTKGAMQGLQHSAAMQAGRVKAFCQQLGWTLMEALMKSLQQRLQFGVLPELCDLMRVELLNGQQARALYQAGIEGVSDLARSGVEVIERILTNMPKFGSAEQENQVQLGIIIEGLGTLSERQAATLILEAARELMQEELGLKNIDWEQRRQLSLTQTPPRSQATQRSQQVYSQESPQVNEIEDAIAVLEASCNTPHRTPAKIDQLSPDPFDDSMESVETAKEEPQIADKVAVISVNKDLQVDFLNTIKQVKTMSLSLALGQDDKIQQVVLACEVASETIIFCLILKEQLEFLSQLLRNRLVQIQMNNSVSKIRLLLDHFNSIDCQLFDPVLAAWILNPDKPSYSLAQVVQGMFPEWTSFVSNLSRQNLCPRSVDEAVTESLMCLKVGSHLQGWLKSYKYMHILTDIDMQAVKVIAGCEQRGFAVSKSEGMALEAKLENALKDLQRKAISLAGCSFDPNKSSDIKKIVYYKLKLGGPKCKPSTSKEALQALEEKHPLPRIILEYRKIHHVLNATVAPVLKNLDKSVLHPRFNFLVATGRIHMHDPNLQSVPRDFALPDGSNLSLRSMFVARPGHTLISADYSQIELRLMAHLSGDEFLTGLLNSGEDVFINLASRINKTENVTEEMRRQAKQICYGLLYGMGVDRLKEELKAPADKVHILYESIQAELSALFDFKESAEQECRKTGKVTTMFGRVRLLNLARNAANSIVQGSAADLAKKAMARVKEALGSQRVEAHLLLHMHDELIYEARMADVDKVVKIVRTEMESVGDGLKVHLPVKVKVGPNWGLLQELITI
ncbi:DNA polymerase theta [Neocloeon triangulifer]|uniref:DNA polymerase theta n=1 Tax=Neocloeon triangulifer TaxID=2078957 RepID=UPI00286EE572|nr:DNA polymerase theta [Neocloeon triangulifer]XP_059490997.1 DNA polymerase theta [Neocloeon triangulifer]XP_059490998.1 DNA polymerase theta [Neocloeon triangulifer]